MRRGWIIVGLLILAIGATIGEINMINLRAELADLKKEVATKAKNAEFQTAFKDVRTEIAETNKAIRTEIQVKIQNEFIDRDRVDGELGRRIDDHGFKITALEYKIAAVDRIMTDVQTAAQGFTAGYVTFNEANGLMREADDNLRQLVVSLEEVRKQAAGVSSVGTPPDVEPAMTVLPSDDQILRTVELEVKLRAALAELAQLREKITGIYEVQQASLEKIDSFDEALKGR